MSLSEPYTTFRRSRSVILPYLCGGAGRRSGLAEMWLTLPPAVDPPPPNL